MPATASMQPSASATERAATGTEQTTWSTERGARSTDHGARSTEHGARSTEHGARSTEHGARKQSRALSKVSSTCRSLLWSPPSMLAFLSTWIEDYYFDFESDPNLFAALLDFLEPQAAPALPYSHTAQRLVRNLERQRATHPPPDPGFLSSPRSALSPSPSRAASPGASGASTSLSPDS